MKRTYTINGQQFKTVNGVTGAIRAYNRKNHTRETFKTVMVKGENQCQRITGR